MVILTGILLGLSTLLFMGPVLFYLTKSAIESGFKAGIAVSLGIISGDILCILIAHSYSEYLFNNTEYQKWFALCGALILLCIGLKYIIKPNLSTEVNGEIENKKLITYFINGFLINFINPFVFVIWVGFISYNLANFSNSETNISLIFTLLTIFATDILKSYFASIIQLFIKPNRIIIMFKLFGVVMILFSIRLLALFFTYLDTIN